MPIPFAMTWKMESNEQVSCTTICFLFIVVALHKLPFFKIGIFIGIKSQYAHGVK